LTEAVNMAQNWAL